MSSPSSENPATAVPTALDAAGVLGWAAEAVQELSERRAEINALNVFPVPDADTGSNMTHTMEAAWAEAMKLPGDADVAEVTQALSIGAVRGARGNSGVVLSQVLRAVAQSAADGVLDARAIRRALGIARSLVDRAITDPVEGTVVTVLRAAAIAAEDSGGDPGRDDMLGVVTDAVDAARTALARTPSQLEVLREAGVVDAGGQGLVILLEALLAQILNNHRQPTDNTATDLPISPSPLNHGRQGELEVMFFITCDSGEDLDLLHTGLAELGRSLIVARETDTRGTVHIHSLRAGEVIELAFASGRVEDLRLEILPDHTVSPEAPNRVVIAVTPYGTLTELYSEAGVWVVPRNPAEADRDESADDIVSTIVTRVRRSEANEVILLPNGLLNKRELASIERSSYAFDQAITILPTSTLVSGIAAASVHDPSQPLGVDAYAMAEAAVAMRTAVLRTATGAALTSVGACSRGDILAFNGPEIILVSEDLTDALARTCLKLLDGGGEQVTLLISQDKAADFNETTFRDGLGTHTDVDITVYPATGMLNLVEIGVE
ncbi:DAK2 domain-containing protein [Corynebacterium pacaense]|uniref:DAK2 domain-containing protein n=1 Tax=Corynebacterium pacaense TaxID=1816684 RepID=UPI0009B9406B|nr:DAK2 domain-containing protein [Corynebacterium pacaense]